MFVDQLEKIINLARLRSGCMATAKDILYQKIECEMKVGLGSELLGRACDAATEEGKGTVVLERNRGWLSQPPASRHMQPYVMPHDLCMLISLQP